MKDVETLINKYFEGETTCEEEQELRHFFTKGLVPEQFQVYCPMFAFFETEHMKYSETADSHQFKVKSKRRKLFLTYGLGIAATLLLMGIIGIFRELTPTSTSYVVIDGKRYTDIKIVRKQALDAFRDVSLSKEDVFETLFEE